MKNNEIKNVRKSAIPKYTFALYLIKYMNSHNITAKGLSESIGVSQRSISRLTKPEITPSTPMLKRFLNILGVDEQDEFFKVVKTTNPDFYNKYYRNNIDVAINNNISLVGDWINKFLVKHGMDKLQLAEKMGISRTSLVDNMLNIKPSNTFITTFEKMLDSKEIISFRKVVEDNKNTNFHSWLYEYMRREKMDIRILANKININLSTLNNMIKRVTPSQILVFAINNILNGKDYLDMCKSLHLDQKFRGEILSGKVAISTPSDAVAVEEAIESKVVVGEVIESDVVVVEEDIETNDVSVEESIDPTHDILEQIDEMSDEINKLKEAVGQLSTNDIHSEFIVRIQPILISSYSKLFSEMYKILDEICNQ